MYDWSAGNKGPKGGKREPGKVPDTQGTLSHVKNGPLPTPPPQILASIIWCMNYYTRFHLPPAAILMPLNLFSMQEIMPSLLKIFYCFLPYWESYSTYLPWSIGDMIYPCTFWLLLIFTFLQLQWPFYSFLEPSRPFLPLGLCPCVSLVLPYLLLLTQSWLRWTSCKGNILTPI